jgi:3-phosphoshikimate 1-carboxyvinyltransferase
VLLAALADGESVIRNPLVSSDTSAAVRVARSFGADVQGDSVWTIKGRGGVLDAPEDVVDVGNSGTTLYIAMGAASLASGHTIFTGDAQIRRRSAGPLLGALQDLGATALSTRGNGCAPLVVGGGLEGGKTNLVCPTSQFLTSLLLCTPLASGDSEIGVSLLYERPYVHITLAWLEGLGVRYEAEEDLSAFRVPGRQSFPAFERTMPGDFSSATFFLCAAAMAGDEVVLDGLDMADPQGDKAVVEYLREMGAEIEVGNGEIVVNGGNLRGAELDLNATPDALPAMAVTACFAEGTTRLVNVPQARMKETDRIAVMAMELSKLGARIREQEDGLEIEGGRLRGGSVHGHDDHRVVMSLALAGLKTDEPVDVDTAEAVEVTLPEFPQRMADLGAELEVES